MCDDLSGRATQEVNSLQERYSAMTTFSKATVHSALAWLKYTGQPMNEYVAHWELCSVQLALMDVPVNKRFLMKRFVELVSSRKRPSYVAVLSALLAKEALSRKQQSTRVLQEYGSLASLKYADDSETGRVFVMSSMKERKDSNRK